MLSEEWEQLVCGQTDDASVANAANAEIKSKRSPYGIRDKYPHKQKRHLSMPFLPSQPQGLTLSA